MGKEKIQPVRGMQDILPKEMRRHRKVTETAREVAQLYGFEHMATPIMESIDVFKRTLGDSSDVVNKEMYSFPDRKGKELVLRPENTASIVRAFISNGLQQSLPARFFYNGPMFRYERPQAGRQRQFHQIGVEALGANDPYADVDIIACACQVLKELGLAERVELQINTLGDSASRASYKEELVKYLEKYKNDLSADSKKRLQTNPLRILDSKDEADKKIIIDAPVLWDSVNRDSHVRFDIVQTALQNLGINPQKNSYLVRGLDYYCHTVFEFVTDDLGAQGTVLAGGRYDGLVKALGGSDIDGVGWAAGVERLALMLEEPEADVPQIALVPFETEIAEVCSLAHYLRHNGIRTDYLYWATPKKHMQHANNTKAQFALLLDSNIRIKDMETGEEHGLPFSDEIMQKLKKAGFLDNLIKALKEYNND